jgi:hypothetical protein
VRDAIIGVLILHPELAEAVPAAVTGAEAPIAEQVVTLVLAALYLQREWYPLLTLARGHPPMRPEAIIAAYWRGRGLPQPETDDGVAGLRTLAEWERRRTHLPANYRGDWEHQVAHLITQEWAARPMVAPARYSLAPPTDAVDGDAPRAQETDRMSLRPDVTRDGIERFLTELGRMVRQPGRIYLAGGAALVHGQVRGAGASTADVDLKLDVADEHVVETAIRQLKTRLGINVKLASPADFIPVPAAWPSTSRYAGRYGALDVFYFDFSALALDLGERGTSRDLRDVELLKDHGLIQRDTLDAAYHAILPEVGHGRFFNLDPALFAQKCAAALQLLWGGEL